MSADNVASGSKALAFAGSLLAENLKVEDIEYESFSDNDSGSGEEDPQTGSKIYRKEIKIGRPLVTKLTPHYKGLMGEANLRLARGETEIARQMCFEVIRQIPNAWEPYLSLAQSFENVDIQKHKSYLTIASYLNRDTSTLCRLAELAMEEGDIKEALSYYSKAAQRTSAPEEIYDIDMKRIAIAEQLDDQLQVLNFKTHQIKHIPKSHYQNLIKLVTDLSKEYNERKRYAKAIEVLQVPFKKVPKLVTQDLVNMLLEMLIQVENYPMCLDLLVQFCNFKLEVSVDEERKVSITTYEMPKETQVDIQAKFIIILIKMGSFHLLNELLDLLLVEQNEEVVGDLYLDIAEALMLAKKMEMALKLFVPLVKSKTYSLAEVWLKYAECLTACNMFEQAVEAYFTVMALAPQHVEVLYPLAMVLLKQDKKKEALEVMSLDMSSEKLDVAVLIERMKLLKSLNEIDEFFKCADLLLSRHCIVFSHIEETKAVLLQRDKIQKIMRMRKFRGESENLFLEKTCIREPSPDVEYKFYKNEILQFTVDMKMYSAFQKYAFIGMTSKVFEKHFDEIWVAAIFSCIYTRDSNSGYFLSKEMAVRNPDFNVCWNLLSTVLQEWDFSKHSKFVDRYTGKDLREKGFLSLIDVNYDILVGNYTNPLKFFYEGV